MSAKDNDKRREKIIEAFRDQARFCRMGGAHFTAAVIDAAHEELEAGGVLFDLVEKVDGDPLKRALALRVAGALHALVLDNRSDELSVFYNSPNKTPDVEALRKIISPLWDRERAHFESYVANAPQTNEVRRAAALLLGFSKIAEISNAPLDLLEVGSSAGLLLTWDKYRYDYGDAQWGEGEAEITSEWRGDEPPELYAPITVRNRAGCDLSPIDLSDPAQLLRARSYIWPEDASRRVLFDKAVEEKLSLGVNVEKADALVWLKAKLSKRADDAVTVIFHSVFSQYLSEDQREQLCAMVEQAGAVAESNAPLAYLRFEPEAFGDALHFNVTLQFWPDGREMHIARAHYHGAWVEPSDAF